MPRLSVSKASGWATGAALLCSVLAPAAAAGRPAGTFESVFQSGDEPAALFYRAEFTGSDGVHVLQVWRDGQVRLRRKTDEVLDTYVVRNSADPLEYQMTVVDYRKRITTRIDRNNLIRLGHFSDWFDLAHGLRHPVGEYRLAPTSAPAGAPIPASACRWYVLSQGNTLNGVLSRNRRKFRQPINVACPAPGRWGRPNSRVTSRHFDHGNASRTSRPDCSGLDEAD
uniref:Uncharacterized protein n=1 Tax=Ralstonia pickettii (strain 12D) TaxID=428406 RepID=C6BNR8_RALP1